VVYAGRVADPPCMGPAVTVEPEVITEPLADLGDDFIERAFDPLHLESALPGKSGKIDVLQRHIGQIDKQIRDDFPGQVVVYLRRIDMPVLPQAALVLRRHLHDRVFPPLETQGGSRNEKGPGVLPIVDAADFFTPSQNELPSLFENGAQKTGQIVRVEEMSVTDRERQRRRLSADRLFRCNLACDVGGQIHA